MSAFELFAFLQGILHVAKTHLPVRLHAGERMSLNGRWTLGTVANHIGQLSEILASCNRAGVSFGVLE